ncbi:MAG TPA: hypothetical protein VKR52_18265 [Terracidiphilus sp.]|nr:hypothetical protein [Terracidiphilus sp.]
MVQDTKGVQNQQSGSGSHSQPGQGQNQGQNQGQQPDQQKKDVHSDDKNQQNQGTQKTGTR